MTDNGLRDVWRNAGGQFHGPNIETGTMPEAKLLPFLRWLLSTERERCADLAVACTAMYEAKYLRDVCLAVADEIRKA